MIEVIGVRFRKNGKIYFFSPSELPIEIGQNVIVETSRGVEYGKVVLGKREIKSEKIISTLKPVIRIATPEDDEINEENMRKSIDAFRICLENIAKHDL